MYSISYGMAGYMPSTVYSVDTLAQAKQCLREEVRISLETYDPEGEDWATFEVFNPLRDITAKALKAAPEMPVIYGYIDNGGGINDVIEIAWTEEDITDSF